MQCWQPSVQKASFHNLTFLVYTYTYILVKHNTIMNIYTILYGAIAMTSFMTLWMYEKFDLISAILGGICMICIYGVAKAFAADMMSTSLED